MLVFLGRQTSLGTGMNRVAPRGVVSGHPNIHSFFITVSRRHLFFSSFTAKTLISLSFGDG
jgi:hypothetical protein